MKIIIGLGKTGLSVVRYFTRNGITFAGADSRPEPPGFVEFHSQFPQVQTSLGGFSQELLEQADELIVSPGVSLHEPAIAKQIERGIKAIGDIELFARAAKAPIVAITGSNGKSTVTTLVGEMAKQAGWNVRVGGNLGTPALDLLEEKEPDLYVVELSSFQLGTTYSLNATAAVVLNLTPDHMDRYASLDEYRDAKTRIYTHCKNAIINRDDAYSYAGAKLPTNIYSFGLDEPKDSQFGLRAVNGKNYLAFGKENLITTDELKIKGRHQLSNVLAALALGHAANIPMAAMLETLRRFTGLAHRCQFVRNIDDVNYYNDSKATNVGAAEAALSGLGAEISGKVVLIAGGQGKGADFSVLRPAVTQYVRTLILIGEDAPKINKALEGYTPIVQAQSMPEAVQLAKKYAIAGDAVLLAPACASFDMFKNFEDRGEVFMSLVKEL
jgi:UDP-N-acetylmuramoylalanine--D-glutamate ligase